MGASGRLGGDDGIDNPDIRDAGIDDPELREGVDNPDIRDAGIDDPELREGVDNPDIRDAGIDDPELSDPGVDNPEIHDTGVGNPDIRDGGVDDPNIRQSIDNPDIRAGVDNPDLMPAAQPMSGGLPVIPIAIGIGVVVVAIAAFSFLGGGGPGSSAGASLAPGATPGPSAPVATQGGGAPAAEETANLVLTGPEVSGTWSLDGNSGDVSPTAELIAAVWTETVDNVAEGYGDLITLALGGPIVEGTQSTSIEGLSLGISISRYDAAGNALSDHNFSSRGGECQVTMARTASGVSGSFSCTGISDADGHTSNATGSFAT